MPQSINFYCHNFNVHLHFTKTLRLHMWMTETVIYFAIQSWMQFILLVSIYCNGETFAALNWHERSPHLQKSFALRNFCCCKLMKWHACTISERFFFICYEIVAACHINSNFKYQHMITIFIQHKSNVKKLIQFEIAFSSDYVAYDKQKDWLLPYFSNDLRCDTPNKSSNFINVF